MSGERERAQRKNTRGRALRAAGTIAIHAVFKQSLSPAVYRCLDVRATACCDRTMQ